MCISWQITIIIIIHRLPVGSIQTTFLGYITLNLFCFYNYGTYNIISHDKSFVHLRYYIPRCLRRAQYGCFL